MLKKLTIVLGMAVAVAGTTTVSSFVFVPEAHAFGLGSIKKAAKKVGRTAKKGGKAVGRTAKKITTGDAVGKAASRYGRKTGRVAKRGGRAFKRSFKCIKKGGCSRIGPLPAGTKGNPRPAVHDHRS